jgi:hypothetical protein
MYLLLLGTRLLPVILIAVLRPAPGWLIVLAALIGVGLSVVGARVDFLRQAYYAIEYTETPAAEVQCARLNRVAPLRASLWLAYTISLIALLIV